MPKLPILQKCCLATVEGELMKNEHTLNRSSLGRYRRRVCP